MRVDQATSPGKLRDLRAQSEPRGQTVFMLETVQDRSESECGLSDDKPVANLREPKK
jgi:hypothetical protein